MSDSVQSTTQPRLSEATRKLRAVIAENGEEGWDVAWKNKVTPWDSGEPQPPLVDLLTSGKLPLPTTGRALVPGCGRAYDAIAIARHLGLETVAIDIAPAAVEAAELLLKNNQDVSTGKLSVKLADFFKLEDQGFDLIYDYTFFVALPPRLRSAWAEKMTDLARPNAYLITLVFPLNEPKDDNGPPFYVEPGHYDKVLHGWEKVLDEEPSIVQKGKEGRQRMVVWKKI